MKALLPLLLTCTISLANEQDVSQKTHECDNVYKDTLQKVVEAKSDDSAVLEITRLHSIKFNDCICEVVKASIIGSEANKQLVSAIVETSILAAPNSLDNVVNCALAIAPDASNEIVSISNAFTEENSSTYVTGTDGKLYYLNGKNGFFGKNGQAFGKNGGAFGKNGGAQAFNIRAQGSPFSNNPLDNLGSGTRFTGFRIDPGTGSRNIPNEGEVPETTEPFIPVTPVPTPSAP